MHTMSVCTRFPWIIVICKPSALVVIILQTTVLLVWRVFGIVAASAHYIACVSVCVYGLSFQGVIAWTGYNYMNWVKRWPIPCWLSFYLLHSNLAKKVVNIFLLCSLSPCRLPLNARLTKPFAQQHRRWFHFHQVFWDDRRNNVHGDNTEANKNLGELRAIVRYKNTYYTSRMLSYRSFARC